ncbi:type II secretion system protein GspM [Novosphingobium lentum]|uniref:type II secretion system protein GspM n=1 Tax=Novosphingobium lentum TaxID=145287 RepID=UPI00082E0846|nr:type II secretion system protein GspM [Novosphingobium lentum]
MIARLALWFRALSERERWLVGVAGLLTAAVVLVYGIVLPVGGAYDAAADRHADTAEGSARLLAQLDALKAPARKAVQARGPVDQQVAASAEAAGFVLQSNQPRGNDQTLVVVPVARPNAALAWLDALGNQGIVLDSLAMTPAADGSVAVNATLRRAGQ